MAKLETLVRSERTVNTTWRLLLHAGKAGWFRVSREMRMGEGDVKGAEMQSLTGTSSKCAMPNGAISLLSGRVSKATDLV